MKSAMGPERDLILGYSTYYKITQEMLYHRESCCKRINTVEMRLRNCIFYCDSRYIVHCMNNYGCSVNKPCLNDSRFCICSLVTFVAQGAEYEPTTVPITLGRGPLPCKHSSSSSKYRTRL
jgi:hypothetical protein